MSLASLATEVPDPIESPTLAKLSAGASFVPSPVTATTSPLLLQQTHEPLFVERPRARHDLQFTARVRAAHRRSSAANSTYRSCGCGPLSAGVVPQVRSGGRSQRAVAAVSPVTILTAIPAVHAAPLRRREPPRAPDRRSPPRPRGGAAPPPLRSRRRSSVGGVGPRRGERAHGAALHTRPVARLNLRRPCRRGVAAWRAPLRAHPL